MIEQWMKQIEAIAFTEQTKEQMERTQKEMQAALAYGIKELESVSQFGFKQLSDLVHVSKPEQVLPTLTQLAQEQMKFATAQAQKTQEWMKSFSSSYSAEAARHASSAQEQSKKAMEAYVQMGKQVAQTVEQTVASVSKNVKQKATR